MTARPRSPPMISFEQEDGSIARYTARELIDSISDIETGRSRDPDPYGIVEAKPEEMGVDGSATVLLEIETKLHDREGPPLSAAHARELRYHKALCIRKLRMIPELAEQTAAYLVEECVYGIYGDFPNLEHLLARVAALLRR